VRLLAIVKAVNDVVTATHSQALCRSSRQPVSSAPITAAVWTAVANSL